MSNLPNGVTQEPTGFYDHSKFGGSKHGCPECGSTFKQFYSANYCPVCKEHVKGRTGDNGSSLAQWSE